MEQICARVLKQFCIMNLSAVIKVEVEDDVEVDNDHDDNNKIWLYCHRHHLSQIVLFM